MAIRGLRFARREGRDMRSGGTWSEAELIPLQGRSPLGLALDAVSVSFRT